jgi:hypothetical protein
MDVGACREAVHARDRGCVAHRIDPHAGPCYDRWGKHIEPVRVGWDEGEMDYVRLDAHGPRHALPEDHIWLCPGHHRGTGPSAGYQWATSHRREERRYLEAITHIMEKHP